MTSSQGRKKIKVLFSIYGLDGGGAERVVATLVNHLDRDRFEPMLALLHEGGRCLGEVHPDVRVFELSRDLPSREMNLLARPPPKWARGPEGRIDPSSTRFHFLGGDTSQGSFNGKVDRPGGFARGHRRIREAVGGYLWADRNKTLLPGPLEDLGIWMNTRHHARRLQPVFDALLCQEQPDAVLSHLLLANTLALNSGACADIFTAVCLHNTPTDNQARVEYKRSPLERADAVVTVSTAIGRMLKEKHGGAKVRVIHNPHDLRHIQELSREPVSHPWFVHKEMPVIAGIGRLCTQKNFALLLEAVSAINRKREVPVRLVIFGEGPERSRLARLIRKRGQQDRILLMGWVPNPFQYLARCDLLALTSQWEGLPNTLIEAMACGVPVVSTNCESGPEEILQGGACGQLVECGDQAGLEEAIQSVLRDPRKAADLRERGRERAGAFDVSVVLPQYETLILEGIERKRREG